MNVESELEKGNFVVGECLKCKKTVWPPSDYCSLCFGNVSIKDGPFQGKIIEFSKQGNDYFCLVEFNENVKIIGKITGETPQINQNVMVKKCGIQNGNYFFEFISS
ncbi:MAG: hypothetical protein K5793_03255 [Nitrosarchaeum sp.]|nr:hypothetical protein [Nitrosarchaeum sp.]MCV0398934.1 hypothetical protein [Nitrosarchaeum sp.]